MTEVGTIPRKRTSPEEIIHKLREAQVLIEDWRRHYNPQRPHSANEHESHYVFDLLFNNTTEVQPTIYSTDTHGSNPINFALLHFFGYQFAPRYRDLYDKVRTSLYGFKHTVTTIRWRSSRYARSGGA